MYLRAIHAEQDLARLQQFIRGNPLGIFTTAIESKSFPFLQSSHIPFVLDIENTADEVHLGILRGHLARANPQAKALIEHLKFQTQDAQTDTVQHIQTVSRDVMILFNGSGHHYVTPKFYRDTKPATGKVVPTWNYSAVQVYGRASVFYDTKAAATGAFLDKQIRDLSLQSERDIMGYEKPWQVDDAPASYIELLRKAIIGVQIEITDIGGKYKMSQEMPAGDRQGVVDGFKAMGSDIGAEMAKNVEEKGNPTYS
uniref:Similar to transcription factor n=1 Tax=Alternaria alternata TaxID=5599 RepID=C9K7D2_ALTAL